VNIPARREVIAEQLSMYLGPVVGAALSINFLGKAPAIVHLIGGVLSLGGMWLSLRRKSEGK
jgi:drug/metabolite transporter (DMT)-like permease